MNHDIINQLMAQKTIKEIATSGQAVDFDRYTISQIGIPEALLIENAGCAIATFVARLIKKASNKPAIWVFCGTGNNGADAIAASRHLLALGLDPVVYLVGHHKKLSAGLLNQLSLLENAIKASTKGCVVPFQAHLISSHDPVIIVDGIFGSGLKSPPKNDAHSAISFINAGKKSRARGLVVSIDIPSGLGLDARPPLGSCVIADHTITFDHCKPVHISEPSKIFCGRVHARPIGLFKSSSITTYWIFRPRVLRELFLAKAHDCHKGSFGHVMVMEGEHCYLGASRLSAQAALRAGAGLLTILTDDNSQSLGMDRPEFMRMNWHEVNEGLLKGIDALVIGPGLGRGAQQARGKQLLKSFGHQIPFIVFDADALPLLKDCALSHNTMVATPHVKEAADLLSWDVQRVMNDRFLALDALAKLPIGQKNQVIWVLKGGSTLVRSPCGHIFVFRGDLPVLSAGGSGDVLSGAIAGLFKQTATPLDAVLLAISLQIAAGKLLSKTIFKGSLASELADLFPLLTKR